MRERAGEYGANQFATCNFHPSAGSLLQIIEVILYRSLVSARNFFLAQRALGIGLRRRGGFFVSNLALAFDTHAFQGDARHLAAGRELPFDFRGLEGVAQLAIAAVGMAARVGVGPDHAGIIPAIRKLAVPSGARIRPCADAATRFAAIRIEAGVVALAPALARAHTRGSFIEGLQLGHDRLAV